MRTVIIRQRSYSRGFIKMQNVIEFAPSTVDRTHWHTIFFVAAFHVLAVVALFTFSWPNLLAALVCWWIAGSWGVGIGYHRLLTHRGLTAPRWLTRFLATCATLAVQSGPIAWVTTHRIHHAFTETEKDPHSPRNGTYWAHVGWIFRGTAQMQPQAAIEKYSPDLIRDPYLVFIDKYYYVTSIIVGAVLLAIGGWTMVMWAIFFRTVVGWHFTWLVNSATHLWGSRRFETRDDSRNNGLIAALTFGEGWHNNHHAYPRSAKHGLAWWEFDVNWVQIRLLEKLGLFKNVYAYELDTDRAATMELKKAA
jgi:stearoyl-CoA desaturase (delta-9 desaturase)